MGFWGFGISTVCDLDAFECLCYHLLDIEANLVYKVVQPLSVEIPFDY